MSMLNEDTDVKLNIGGELRQIHPGTETIIDVINEVGDDGIPIKRIVHGNRRLQPEPPTEREVARAKARDHEFHSIDAFCGYLSRECEVLSSLVLADVDSERMRATLDESAESDREFVQFAATTHPLFRPWLDLVDTSTPVLDFALFAMRYRSAIVQPDGRELALTFSQIKSSKTITKKSGVGAKTLNGVMVETVIGSERHEVAVELPERMTICVPLFLDTDPVDVDLDLLVTDTPNGIVVFVAAPSLQEAKFRAFGQFVETVRKQTELLVGFGRVRERDWNLIR
ncbi:hypothetical protein [Novipirellula caenicola]|uniref:DUF2303 family protein n=1 Tax=Novipirellula caenicola TaxID=1536901 RepID=A0ABP9VZ81_9BACT